MAQLEITRFLKQAVLDSAFRELVLTDPEKSFAGFALSDAEKQILKAKSPEISTLVATAITDTMNPYDGPKSADEQGAINYVTEFIWA